MVVGAVLERYGTRGEIHDVDYFCNACPARKAEEVEISERHAPRWFTPFTDGGIGSTARP
jgi:hypothetical protein